MMTSSYFFGKCFFLRLHFYRFLKVRIRPSSSSSHITSPKASYAERIAS